MTRTRFVWFGSAAAVAAIGLLVCNILRVGGDAATAASQDVGEAAAALLAAGACAYTAGRSSGSTRIAWALIAASALSWATGETVWTVYEVGLNQAVPFPSLADVGFLVAIPFMIAGVLQLTYHEKRPLGRTHSVLDAMILAVALVYIVWGAGLNDLYLKGSIGGMGRALVTVYPVSDVVILTLLVAALRKAGRDLRVTLGPLIAAYLTILAADSSFAYLMLRGQYGLLGSISDNGWVAGYLLVGLAAQFPVREVAAASDDHTVERWQLAMPWLCALAVIATATWHTITHAPSSPVLGGIAVTFGLLFLASQGLAFTHTLDLLSASRRAEVRIREQTKLVTELFYRAPVGILRVGPDLNVIDSNPAARAIVRTEINKHSRVTDYLTAEEMQRLAILIRPLWSDETDSVEADQDARRADGSPMWIHWSVTAIRKPDRDIDYLLVVMQDITVKHDNEVAARANTAMLERLNRLKSEFMSLVSHEFRTALTGIQGYSEVMATQEVTPEEVKEFSGDINSDALRLNRMITEMLDLDRIESGRISLRLEPVDLNGLVHEAAGRARMLSGKHQISTDLDPAVPRVVADRDRLTEVLSNLLSNAVKYSPAGGDIVVSTRMSAGAVEVSVKDHGQGIPPEFIERIFSRYERYEQAGKPQVVGTGLGLAITKQIVQMHQGQIWVESKLGEGSEFHFTVPLGATSAQPAAQGRVA